MHAGRPTSWLETTTNVAILVTCAFIVVMLARRMWTEHDSQLRRPPAVSTGEDLGTIPEIDRTPPSRRLVLAVSRRCRFCSASLESYSRLTAIRTGAEVVVVADDEPEILAAYLRAGQVRADRIVTPVPKQLRIHALPTTLLLDERNRVLAVWVGSVSSETEAEIRAAVSGTATAG